MEGVVGDADRQQDFNRRQLPGDAERVQEALAVNAEKVQVFHQAEVANGDGDGDFQRALAAVILDVARGEVDKGRIQQKFERKQQAVGRHQRVAGSEQQVVLQVEAAAQAPVQRKEGQKRRDEFGGEVTHAAIIAESANINNLYNHGKLREIFARRALRYQTGIIDIRGNARHDARVFPLSGGNHVEKIGKNGVLSGRASAVSGAGRSQDAA